LYAGRLHTREPARRAESDGGSYIENRSPTTTVLGG